MVPSSVPWVVIIKVSQQEHYQCLCVKLKVNIKNKLLTIKSKANKYWQILAITYWWN